MSATEAPTRQKRLTIGAVCDRLKAEFPDISISKIRYLEDRGLLAPRRTRGGYRMFSEADVERLETILRLQRDEFLPLNVIRQELASPGSAERRRKRPLGASAEEEQEISYRRRLLHGKIDILRAELVARLQKTEGRSVLDQLDVDRLTEILTSKAAPPA